MITQELYIPRYDWCVRAYYAVSTYWAGKILRDLEGIGCRGLELATARKNLLAGDLDTGLTYSDISGHNSVMVISLTSSPAEFLNSWMHEMRHLSRHIEQACGISPYGEEAAYLAGEIGQRMFPVAKRFLCEHCRKELTYGEIHKHTDRRSRRHEVL